MNEKMNEIVKKTIKEFIRILLSAVLAALGVSATGCIAIGDGASCSVLYPSNISKGE